MNYSSFDKKSPIRSVHETLSLKDYTTLINSIIDIYNKQNNLIVMLTGDLGSGKTTFTKLLLQSLGYEKNVRSPTFTLMNEYKFNDNQVYHLDLYRIDKTIELEELKLQKLIKKDFKTLIIIEWADLFSNYLENTFKDIKKIMIDFKINYTNQDTRDITFITN